MISDCPPIPARLTADGNGEVAIVVFTDDFSAARKSLEPFPCGIVGSYPFISAFGATVNVHKLSDLCRLPCVRSVAAHTTVTALSPLSSLAGSAARVAEKTAEKSAGSVPKGTASKSVPTGKGKGVRVAVIDTGVGPHLDFLVPRYRLAEFRDFVGGKAEPYDDNGHGSAVAGLAVGNGLTSGGRCGGSAPEAELVALKALDRRGEGSAFHILEAMQWVFDNRLRLNIRVACMSFGTRPLSRDDPLVLGAEALWQAGVTVVASAGNSGPKYGTVTSPGCSADIITVGAAYFTEDGDFAVPDFSSRGTEGEGPIKPELVACGVDVCCCAARGGYVTLSGTSMAAPTVAGYAADLISANPRLTPDRVKEILIGSALPPRRSDPAAGYGLARLVPPEN